MKHKWMQTREKKHKEYQRITCIKKIALQQQCSVLLNYWLTLKFNWTKLQHNLLQLDTMSLGENFSDLIYWILSITTLSTWEFCNSECLWKRPQIQVWPPLPPPLGEFFAYRYKNFRLPVPSFLIPWFCIFATVSSSKGTRNEYTGSRR